MMSDEEIRVIRKRAERLLGRPSDAYRQDDGSGREYDIDEVAEALLELLAEHPVDSSSAIPEPLAEDFARNPETDLSRSSHPDIFHISAKPWIRRAVHAEKERDKLRSRMAEMCREIRDVRILIENS